jgi:DNA-binding FrmR family transcriptional regulator
VEVRLSKPVKHVAKMLTRIRRVRGQIEAIERTLNVGSDYEKILQLVAACRGALNGLMVELIEGCLRCHVLGEGHQTVASTPQTAEELVAMVKRYFT